MLLCVTPNDGGLWRSSSEIPRTRVPLDLECLSDGAHQTDRDLDADILSSAGNNMPSGLWSDDATMWVAEYSAMHIFAYNLATKARQESREIALSTTPTASGPVDARLWCPVGSAAR